MKKIMAGVLGFLMVGMITVEADAASRVSSSRSSFSSSSSRSSYSAPKSSYSAPKQQAGTSSNPGLKALGFSRPATNPTVSSRPSANPSPSVSKTTTTSGGWFSKKTVSSAPAYKAPARKVMSPTSYRSDTTYRSQPRNVTVIQRNYYGGNSYGYNRGYGGGYYGHGYGYNSYGSGFGSSFAGTLGGMMMYNALFNNHSSHASSGATAQQIEQAKQDQRIEDKLDRVLDQQPQGVMPMAVAQQAPVVTAQPQVASQAQPCYLPEDAPLMMNPKFYCEGVK